MGMSTAQTGTEHHHESRQDDDARLRHFQSLTREQVIQELRSTFHGLSEADVHQRLTEYGYNEVVTKKEIGLVRELLTRFASPLVLMLLALAVISFFFGDKVSAFIIAAMAILSVVLSYIQEHRAENNAAKLQAMVRITARVMRQSGVVDVQLRNLVPGDIVELSAGDLVPADVRIIASKDLFITQSALNGESFPVEKWPDHPDTTPGSVFDLPNIACMGGSVVSGSAQGVVIATGRHTQFGQLSQHLQSGETQTSFDRGISSFTWLMIKLIAALSLFIFAVNAIFKHDILDALLFAVAVAVGLAPEMLPMIVTVNLSKGALDMAKKKVIIKRLDAIQNFGAMDVLCTDKTGTLTLDDVRLVKHCDVEGREDEQILKDAYLTSAFQTGMNNVLEKAVLRATTLDISGISKIDEIPFDFQRKILSVVVDIDGKHRIITKGAPEEVFKRSAKFVDQGRIRAFSGAEEDKIVKLEEAFSREGYRVLAIAYRDVADQQTAYSPSDERDLVFAGFIAFLDPPKESAIEAIRQLEELGITLKVLSGDNELVNEKIGRQVGLSVDHVLTGRDIDLLNDDELRIAADRTTIFARVTPIQKERIIRALQRGGHNVGYMGDGINDAPALKAADVGLSVDNAVDIAKENADIILLEKSLLVLSNVVTEGRKTFANSLKYIKMGASSNFGNMLSMTGASILLPFLPMLPTQILLNNFLYDLSQVTIPTDNVDEDYLKRPRPWNIGFIRKFILALGPVSSLFDFLTFGVMWYLFHASPDLFRTGWFVESLFTQTFVIYIIRTQKIPFFESRPSRTLLLSTLAIVAFGCILPYTPLGTFFHFVPLPPLFFGILAAMALAYLFLAQFVKARFIRKFGFD